jgi:hypothetical protein
MVEFHAQCFGTIVSSKKTIFPENYQSLSVKIKTSFFIKRNFGFEMTLRMKLLNQQLVQY